MKVYVLTLEPDHANSTVLGCYASLELAQKAMQEEHGYPLKWEECWASGRITVWCADRPGKYKTYEGYEIREEELVTEETPGCGICGAMSGDKHGLASHAAAGTFDTRS